MSLPEIRARQRQPHMPGPWSDEMRSLSQYLLAPAAVAEDSERRRWVPGVTFLAKRADRFPRSQPILPFRMNHARCPGRMLQIPRTRPVEARPSAKIALHESGLRPLSHPSSRNRQYCRSCDDRIPERTHAKPGKAPRQGISSSRVKEDCLRIVYCSSEISVSPVRNLWELVRTCG